MFTNSFTQGEKQDTIMKKYKTQERKKSADKLKRGFCGSIDNSAM